MKLKAPPKRDSLDLPTEPVHFSRLLINSDIAANSGSSFVFQNFPPACVGAPPSPLERGFSAKGLWRGCPGITRRDTTSKLRRDWASVHVLLPSDRGTSLIRVITVVWQEKHG